MVDAAGQVETNNRSLAILQTRNGGFRVKHVPHDLKETTVYNRVLGTILGKATALLERTTSEPQSARDFWSSFLHAFKISSGKARFLIEQLSNLIRNGDLDVESVRKAGITNDPIVQALHQPEGIGKLASPLNGFVQHLRQAGEDQPHLHVGTEGLYLNTLDVLNHIVLSLKQAGTNK